jgi:hypothetical protein
MVASVNIKLYVKKSSVSFPGKVCLWKPVLRFDCHGVHLEGVELDTSSYAIYTWSVGACSTRRCAAWRPALIEGDSKP